MKVLLRLLPLAVFAALAVLLARGLTLDPSRLPSPLIDKPAPDFEVASLRDADAPFRSSDMQGQVWVLNIWASWCGPCRAEHPVLTDLAARRDTPVVGLNYKDQPEDARQWLQRFGDPFSAVLDDRSGDIGLDWGVYGVPETFVIDASGRVRYKHVGPLTATDLEQTVLPIVDRLVADAG